MKIATFNINSVRIRQDDLITWMKTDDITLVALQETKVQDKDFPKDKFVEAGFNVVFKGEKSRNGVAIISKKELKNTLYDFTDTSLNKEARFIQTTIDDITVINTYVPQGREVNTDHFQYKLDFLNAIKIFIEKNFLPTDKLIWLGDINVAPKNIDVYDPEKLAGEVGFHPDEINALQNILNWGLEDIFRKHVPDKDHYTFWDYRIPNALKRGIGWRIDHILATKNMADLSKSVYIATKLRETERPSDHAPLVAEFITI